MKLVPLVLALVGSLVGQEEEAAVVPKPNIIFLMADDQNTLSMGCYGNPEVQTPNMDGLANDGMIFDRHYDTTAICMGSRANVFTGMYEYKTGCNFVHGNMSAEIWSKSYPVRLREAGYLTAFAGKFGIVVDGKGICEEEFDFYGGAKGQSDYVTAKNPSMNRFASKYPHSTLSYGAFGKEVIRESVEKKKPFCLSISFKAPHRPTTPDPRFDHVYNGKKFTKPANYGRRYGEHLAPQSKQGRQYPRFEEWGYDKRYDEVMATYYQQIYAIDFALGMIRDELKSQEIIDNTVIIYTSDNGFICGAHGFGSKVLPMEESSRVPLIIFDPRAETSGKQIRCDRLTGNIDFAPTILELAGLEATENMDGKSLLPLLEKPKEGGHETLALMNTFPPAPTTCMSIVSGPFKYTYWWYENDEMKPTEELFNLGNDPMELTNLVTMPEQRKHLESIRGKYDARLKHWKDQAVKGNGYQKYITLFNRTLPMSDKAPLLKVKKKRKAR